MRWLLFTSSVFYCCTTNLHRIALAFPTLSRISVYFFQYKPVKPLGNPTKRLLNSLKKFLKRFSMHRVVNSHRIIRKLHKKSFLQPIRRRLVRQKHQQKSYRCDKLELQKTEGFSSKASRKTYWRHFDCADYICKSQYSFYSRRAAAKRLLVG